MRLAMARTSAKLSGHTQGHTSPVPLIRSPSVPSRIDPLTELILFGISRRVQSIPLAPVDS